MTSSLCDSIEEECFEAEVALSLDFHSGFGAQDRPWYPYAKRRGGFPRADACQRFASLLDRAYSNHAYLIEPQAEISTTIGDLWDPLFDRHWARHGADGPMLLPWTLEMVIWAWVRKNPRQIFRASGAFNPVVPHRLQRVTRRHLALTDVSMIATDNHRLWSAAEDALTSAALMEPGWSRDRSS